VLRKELNDRSRKARILIVDDHPIIREGLAMHIATQPDLEVAGEAEDSPTALMLLESGQFDLAIIDISLKDSNGLELTRRIKNLYKDIRILIWSMYPENIYAERALRAGALGYLNKEEATQLVLEAIRSVLQGQLYMSGELASQFVHRAVGQRLEERSPIERLTDRELEAFHCIGEGMTTESIAKKMNVSPKTVETFRSRIKEKLGIGNINELIQRACYWVVECKRRIE
jgi:two-component system response regulator NreC